MSGECFLTQLIDGNGGFNVTGLERFVDAVNLSQYGLSYAVVAIIGPQSGGKSTLLNHLFNINFQEMDAYKGRSQTTKGIWIAKAKGMKPCTLVLDLEGTDGRERGEDDTAFEKQSALFALAIADIVLINMWCHDIGREHAANKPLLKTVFQVMMRLFNPRKTTLMFVIRDITKTPLKHLEPILREDIQKIWDLVYKPQVHEETPFSDFFNVEVTALSSYEEKQEQFKEQVAQLRKRLYNSNVPGGLAGDRQAVVPASAFSLSAQQIWEVIRENKDLDLPSHKIMVATIRCEDIANEKLIHFTSDEGWVTLERAVQVGPVAGFGEKLSSILETYLTKYDTEATHFDEGVKSAKRKQLERKALSLVYPAYSTMLGHIRNKALHSFKIQLDQLLNKGVGFAAAVYKSTASSMHEFDRGSAEAIIKQANWDATRVREKLHRDIDAYALSVRSAKLSEIIADFEKQLTEALYEPVQSLLETGRQDTWTSIRKLLKRETDAAVSRFSTSLASFELDQTSFDNMVQSLRVHAISVIEKKAREEAGRVLIHMKERFLTIFNHDNDSLPRVWTGKVDIRKITKDARSASLQLLSVMAAIRLDDKPDKIESILSSSLMGRTVALLDRSLAASEDPLASSTWDKVPLKDTLITPVQCKSLWRQFIAETEYTVTQAISAQETHRQSDNWLPPPWAILTMIILGFNEFMLLLKNPFYLLVVFVVSLLSKALWVQMDIGGEFRSGMLAGILSISSRFLPRVINLVRRLAEKAQWLPTYDASQPSRYVASQSFRNQTHQQSSISGSFRNSSISSHISAERDIEYSSPTLKHRRVTTVHETELSE